MYGSEVRKISTVKMIEEQSRGEDEYKNSDTIKGSESTVKTSEKVIVTAGLSQIYKKAINQ